MQNENHTEEIVFVVYFYCWLGHSVKSIKCVCHIVKIVKKSTTIRAMVTVMFKHRAMDKHLAMDKHRDVQECHLRPSPQTHSLR